MFDDDDNAATTNKPVTITPGEDLYTLSLDDLAERKELIQVEIARIDKITEKKRAGRTAADAVFKV